MTPRMPSSRTETRTTGAGLRTRTESTTTTSEQGRNTTGAPETEARTMQLSELIDMRTEAEQVGETTPWPPDPCDATRPTWITGPPTTRPPAFFPDEETVMNQLEMLARDRINQRSQRQERSGIRRSARLIAQEIRASRRHNQK